MPKSKKRTRKTWTEAEIADIRKLAASGETDEAIANLLGGSKSSIGGIRSGRTYTHHGGPRTQHARGGYRGGAKTITNGEVAGMSGKLGKLKEAWYELKASVKMIQQRMADIEELLGV